MKFLRRFTAAARSGRKPATREAILLAGIDRQTPGLEIGPSHRPVAAKRDGHNVSILDHLDAPALRAKYADHGVDVAAIEEVDYVWTGQPLDELVGGRQFSWIIASHVIEHVPDFVGFLHACERILAPGGVLSLAVPDKRYCFDCERENSSLGRVIDVALAKATNHTPGIAAEYFLKVRRKGGRIAWHEGAKGDLEPVHGLADAVSALEKVREGHYFDLHSWVFTPDSFRQMIRDLRALGMTGFEERAFHA
ncbi:MAG: methyltransferase domain-containing protein, partial [Planctomycetia bacterium]